MSDPIKTYFWMVHYDTTPDAPADGLVPIAAGRKRGIFVIVRSITADHTLDFRMPRENEGGTADPKTYRGSPDLRNRILGFYASPEDANKHLDEIWDLMREKCGAVYAELHSMRVEIAQELKLAA